MHYEPVHDGITNQLTRRSGPARNRLLAMLPDAEFAGVTEVMEEVPLVARRVIQEPHAPVASLFFITEGLVSLAMNAGQGEGVETGVVGPEGAVGAALALGVFSLPWRATVRVAGRAWRMPASHLKPLMEINHDFAALMLRYIAGSLYETAQQAACASRHTISQRIARWLLSSQDRLGGATITCTHESLSQALGVRRAGVTVGLGKMEADGLIRQSRGAVVVADRARVEAQSCECHRLSRLNVERVMG